MLLHFQISKFGFQHLFLDSSLLSIASADESLYNYDTHMNEQEYDHWPFKGVCLIHDALRVDLVVVKENVQTYDKQRECCLQVNVSSRFLSLCNRE